MSTFAKIWLIIKSYKVSILIQFGVFIALAVALTFFLGQVSDDEFQPVSDVNIAIFDRDQTEITENFITFMSDIHNVVELEDNHEAWLDGASWGAVALVLEFPEGFTDSLLSGYGNVPMEYLADAGSVNGFLVRGQVERYFSILGMYIAGGFDVVDASTLVAQDLNGGVEVELVRIEDEADLAGSYMFYRFLPMILPSIVGLATGGVFLALSKDDVRRRIESAPVGYLRRTTERILACISFGILAWAVFVGASIILYGRVMFETWGLIRMLNALPLIFMGVALAFVITLFIKKRDMLFGFVFSTVMILVFPAGITIDMDMMGEQVLSFARFTPFYWYTRVNEMLVPGGYLDWTLLAQGLVIQLAFAAAILAVGMVFNKEKRAKQG